MAETCTAEQKAVLKWQAVRPSQEQQQQQQQLWVKKWHIAIQTVPNYDGTKRTKQFQITTAQSEPNGSKLQRHIAIQTILPPQTLQCVKTGVCHIRNLPSFYEPPNFDCWIKEKIYSLFVENISNDL
jgi:cell division protein FtsN